MLIVWAEKTSIPLMQSLQKLMLVEAREGTGIDKRWREIVLFRRNLKWSLSVQTRTSMFALLLCNPSQSALTQKCGTLISLGASSAETCVAEMTTVKLHLQYSKQLTGANSVIW